MEPVPGKGAARGAPCELHATAGRRLRGLLGRPPDGAWHLLVPCADVHTFGMARELDIAFIGRDGTVLSAHRRVGKNRRLRCRRAAAAIERFASDEPWLRAGERIEMTAGPREAGAAARTLEGETI